MHASILLRVDGETEIIEADEAYKSEGGKVITTVGRILVESAGGQV